MCPCIDSTTRKSVDAVPCRLSFEPIFWSPLQAIRDRNALPVFQRLSSHTLSHSICSTTMSLYDLHDASLNDMDGEGFAYSEKTVYGKAYKGVFFGEDEEEIESLADGEDDATFEGILYDRSREREKSFSVEVTDVVSTPSGERADFVATEKP